MTNIVHSHLSSPKSHQKGCKCPENGAPLDTLAQLTTGDLDHQKKSLNKFIKRQKAKAITMGQIFPLIDLKNRMEKSYWRSYHCNNLLLQEGQKVTTKYCNARWCSVCNRIRMAKMINAYSIPILKFKDLHFVTLTTPNVVADNLKNEIEGMYKSWRCINKNMRKTYDLNIKGIRKLEVTFKPRTGFNPHFHILIDGKTEAKKLIELWLKRYPSASFKAQDMRRANEGSLIELFKYTVKGIHKGTYHVEAVDIIFQALENKRTYQPFGIKKVVEEDINGIKSEPVSFKGHRDDQWRWSTLAKDWVNDDGELFTEYIIEGKLTDWIKDLTEELVEPEKEQDVIKLNRAEANNAKWGFYSEMADELVNTS